MILRHSLRLCCGALVLLALAGAASGQRTLRVDVDLVSLFLTVHTPDGRFAEGLTAGDFRVFEDGVEQKISVFEKDDQVDSAIGVLLDSSLSVVDILPMMKTGLMDFARKYPGFQDVFVMTFGNRVRILHDYGESLDHLDIELKQLRPFGASVFFDGLIRGMDEVRSRRPDRKALIVFTDGLDNGSRAPYREVLLEAQRTGALLYFIPIGARVLLDENTLNSLARETGGRVLYLAKNDPVAPAMDSIRQELARQYYIGYHTSPKPGFHRIRIETPGKELKIRAKTGYYGG
jgi:Ca-activated chloride channel family protein